MTETGEDLKIAELNYFNGFLEPTSAFYKKSINPFDDIYLSLLEKFADKSTLVSVYLSFDLSLGFPNLLEMFSKSQLIDIYNNYIDNSRLSCSRNDVFTVVFDDIEFVDLARHVVFNSMCAIKNNGTRLDMLILELECDDFEVLKSQLDYISQPLKKLNFVNFNDYKLSEDNLELL
jgi:hypothetical protein